MEINKEMVIPAGKISLKSNLIIPSGAKSIVIFSHGSGSGRFSPRNNFVALALHKEKIATLLIDLLTPIEDELYENRMNIDLLADRLVIATKYVLNLNELKDFNVGYFGASTGAASALQAAEELPNVIDAIVSRGGRTDLTPSLSRVQAPALLIIGGLDEDVIEINKDAFIHLQCYKKMIIVKGATHLFEEPGKLEEVAKLSVDWYKKFLLKTIPAT